MATSYIANLKVPTSATFNNGGFVDFRQFDSGNAGPITGITAILNEVKAIYEVKYGGTLSWTSQTNGSFVDYSITYEGLTTDPATDSLNGFDIVMFAVQDDSLEYYSAAWISTNVCEENGLCPPSVNPEDATDCLSCYQQTISTCPDTIVIEGLDTDTEYVFTVTDNVSGKKYTYAVTSDGFGDGTIDTTAFPAGLFTPYNSPMTLTITENGSPVTLTYGYVNYSCIELVINNDEAL